MLPGHWDGLKPNRGYSMAGSLFSKIAQIIRHNGWRFLIHEIRRKLYDSHHSVWFAISLADEIKVIKPRFDGRLDFDNPEEVIRFIEKYDIPGTNDPIEMSSILDRKQYFVGIKNGDDLIGYIKIGWDKVYIVDYGLDFEMPSGCYFIIDIFVDPDARGMGAGPFLSSASAAEMKNRGFKSSIMHVRTSKTPMLKSAVHAGYSEIGRVKYSSILGRKLFHPHPLKLLSDWNQGSASKND